MSPRLAIVVFFVAAMEAVAGIETLEFSFITSFGRFGFNSSGTVPAVDLALEHIDQNQILPGYKLQYGRVRDSMCNRGSSMDVFFDEIQSEPTKIAVVGCGCSVATVPIAEISHHWNISMISYSSAASELSDGIRFRNYFRTVPTFERLSFALLSLINHHNWERIAFFTQDANVFNTLYSDFVKLVDNVVANETDICCFNPTDITIINRVFQTGSDPIPAIEDVLVKDGDYRVFMLNGFSSIGRQIICEAYKRDLVYPNYVWIMFGGFPHEWWTTEVSGGVPVDCTDEELEQFLLDARPILFHSTPEPAVSDIHEITISGISSAEFDQLYDQRIEEENYAHTNANGAAYDAVWALALALNKTQEMVERNDSSETGCSNTSGRLVPLHKFEYSNEMMGCVIRWNLEQTDFTGVSGPVSFDAAGTIRQDQIGLDQYRKGTGNDSTVVQHRYGYFDITGRWALIYEGTDSDSTVFPDGIPPDGTPRVVIHTYVTGLLTTHALAVLGIVFAVVCLVFNFVYRNTKIVQLTSPNLNYLIVAGAILMYASVFVRVLPSTNQDIIYALCILHTWLYIIGYLLVFGTILAKMWRVYHIFHNPAPQKMALRDWHLFLVVLVVTGVGILLDTIHSAVEVDPPVLVDDEEHPEGQTELGIREEYYVYECYETDSLPFYCDLVIFAYLAILQLVGIILAFQTRKVKIPVLNDSKFIAALIYISSIILIILVFVTLPLQGYINVKGAIFATGALLLATIFLALTFVPKMVDLYRDPNGDRIFARTNPTTVIGEQGAKTVPRGMSINISSSKAADLIPPLQDQIKQQKDDIEEKKRRIHELEEILNTPQDDRLKVVSHPCYSVNT